MKKVSRSWIAVESYTRDHVFMFQGPSSSVSKRLRQKTRCFLEN